MDIALPRGYALNEYRIESTLGVGGFGLTYLATDCNLNLKVAIKEYLPADLVRRYDDQSVRSKSEAMLETFNWGRKRFLDESRTLASFHHPNIVRVMRFFEANQTAYMVMEFVAGQPLNEWVKQRRPLPEVALLAIAAPLLEGLEVVHCAGYLHRDIKPGNIFIRGDGSPVLIDFGSARAVTPDSELTSIVSPGFAPFEQYHTRGGQGPWSDLYAVGGVLYWIAVGERPVEAPARAFKDPMRPAVEAADRARYSEHLLRAIDWALSPRPEMRPKTVAELRGALTGQRDAPVSQLATVFGHDEANVPTAVGGAVDSPPAPAIGEEILHRMAAELAAHIGPIASKLVHAEAKKESAIDRLVERLAAEIMDQQSRASFVRRFRAESHVAPADASASSARIASQSSQPGSVSLRLDQTVIARAEGELSKHIGAVARVVVRRAAAKARDESELYLLIAEHIEDEDEKKAFIRKAMSISGRQ